MHGRYEQSLPEELISSEPKPTPYVNDPRRAALLESGGVHGRYDAPITTKAPAAEPEQLDNQHRATAFESGGVHGRYDNLSITGKLFSNTYIFKILILTIYVRGTPCCAASRRQELFHFWLTADILTSFVNTHQAPRKTQI